MLSISTLAFSTDTTEDIGKKLFQEKCSECHQQDGNSKDKEIPNIAGTSAILTFDIMDQFKSGDRKSKPIKLKDSAATGDKTETDMNEITKALKTNEIEAIAFFLVKQKSKPASQAFDQDLAKKGKEIHMDLCENCHVDEGTNNIEDASILRGQWKNYLQSQFKVLSEGERYMPRRMKKRFRKLSDEDKKALIEFYISPAN
ncbi:c-type cytochrome [uncultured Cocleimonas sp.]|uniref:c-type cytochrome n=1 Tax=uncultured Cocleimonas sp. TaxID=1051587 RepID=UPI002632F06D|nr:c-type cytochrome [uncultured Cocleimonas sp.]